MNRWRAVFAGSMLAFVIVFLLYIKNELPVLKFIWMQSANWTVLAIRPNQGIYFIETNVNRVMLPSLVHCAIESAARHNPDKDVYFIHAASRSPPNFPEYISAFPHIRILPINFTELANGSQVESIWPKVEASRFKYETMSDTLRVLLLHKHGGYYLDTDLISLKPLTEDQNTIAMEDSNTVVNGAFLHFNQGHEFLSLALQEIATNFNGDVFGYQGPTMITRLLKSFCNLQKHKALHAGPCTDNLYISASPTAYPIHYNNYQSFYNASKMISTLNSINGSIAVHVWNGMCKDCSRNITVDMPLFSIMKKNCPSTANSIASIKTNAAKQAGKSFYTKR